MPRQWAPYHLRLDWLMWFAALSPHYARDWLGPFVERLLQNDRDAAAAAPQSVPRVAAAVCARAALPVPVHHLARTLARARVVASHPGRRIPATRHTRESGIARDYVTSETESATAQLARMGPDVLGSTPTTLRGRMSTSATTSCLMETAADEGWPLYIADIDADLDDLERVA